MQRQQNGQAKTKSTTGQLTRQLAPAPLSFQTLMAVLCNVNVSIPGLCVLILEYCDPPYRMTIEAGHFGKTFFTGLTNIKSAAQALFDAEEKFPDFMPLILSSKQIVDVKAESEQKNQVMKYAAEEMLQQNASLALVRGPVKLAHGNYEMTALQNAYFKYDCELWEMLMRYMSPEEVARQLKQHLVDCKKRKLPPHVDVQCLVESKEQNKK